MWIYQGKSTFYKPYCVSWRN